MVAWELEGEGEQEERDDGGGLQGLVVGNYCHDVLFRDGRVVGESLGGAASFISNVFDSLSLPGGGHQPPFLLRRRRGVGAAPPLLGCCRYVSKVGPDFAYHAPLGGPSRPHPLPAPIPAPSPTTLFHAHFSSRGGRTRYHADRVLKRVRACDPISPSDLPEGGRFDFGLAVGVAGEISPDTLARMIELCRIVFVDVQALIRTFDPVDGTVHLVPLADSGFSHLLPRIAFLKASADEAPYVDVEEARKRCCVVVTDGKDGCRVYWQSGDLRVPAFPTVQIDPTGAGDSFLGGFVAGLVHGLTVPDAALLGNFFGSLTVGQVGVPIFDPRMLQRVKDELERKMILCGCSCERRVIGASYRLSEEHEEFQAFLTDASKLECYDNPSVQEDEHEKQCKERQLLDFTSDEVSLPGEDHCRKSLINGIH